MENSIDNKKIIEKKSKNILGTLSVVFASLAFVLAVGVPVIFIVKRIPQNFNILPLIGSVIAIALEILSIKFGSASLILVLTKKTKSLLLPIVGIAMSFILIPISILVFGISYTSGVSINDINNTDEEDAKNSITSNYLGSVDKDGVLGSDLTANDASDNEDLKIEVTDIKRNYKIKDDQPSDENEFIKVFLKLENKSLDKTISVDEYDFYTFNSKQIANGEVPDLISVYLSGEDEVTSYSESASNEEPNVRSISPNSSETCSVIFEVPKNIEDIKIVKMG